MVLSHKIIKNIAKSRFSRIFNQKEQGDITRGKADKINSKGKYKYKYQYLAVFFRLKKSAREYCLLENRGPVQHLGTNSFFESA